MRYFKRNGEPYENFVDWAKDFEKQDRSVAKTFLRWGGFVSTVWIGMDYSLGDGPPLIFESMVFDKNDGGELDVDRYSTEEQAKQGHEKLCKRWAEARK